MVYTTSYYKLFFLFGFFLVGIVRTCIGGSYPSRTGTIYIDDFVPHFNYDCATAINSTLSIKSSKTTVLVFGAKEYKISRKIITKSPVVFLGIRDSTSFISDTDYLDAFIQSTSTFNFFNLSFDGQFNVSYGINSYSELVVADSKFFKLKGNHERPGIGIRHLNNNSIQIYRSEFSSIYGAEDGIVGNSIGANRGVYVRSNSNILIKDCSFVDVIGAEDSDALRIESALRSSGRWAKVDALVEGCFFNNFGKRAVKIMASGVEVRDCYIVGGGNGVSSAFSLYGNDNLIVRNRIELLESIYCFFLKGGNSYLGHNDIFLSSNKSQRVFFGKGVASSCIASNNLHLNHKFPMRYVYGASTEPDSRTAENPLIYGNNILLY